VAWPVVYYRAADRSEPVNDEIDALPVKVQVAIDNQIERLGLFGRDLGFPYTSQIEGELRELRCHFGGDHYRILYRRSENLFVLLHFLEKRSAAVPAADIKVAKARWDDFVSRMNERPRRPPRAAGHDAP
jgi:phage-related protein